MGMKCGLRARRGEARLVMAEAASTTVELLPTAVVGAEMAVGCLRGVRIDRALVSVALHAVACAGRISAHREYDPCDIEAAARTSRSRAQMMHPNLLDEMRAQGGQ